VAKPLGGGHDLLHVTQVTLDHAGRDGRFVASYCGHRAPRERIKETGSRHEWGWPRRLVLGPAPSNRAVGDDAVERRAP
jgi:hypothetical protein